MTDPNTPDRPNRPTLTQLEANQLVFLAGVKAEREAKAQGLSPEDGATLLDAASGGVVIGGLKFPPIHGAFMLMLERAEAFAEKRKVLKSDFGDMASLAFILKNPELAWGMLRNESAAELYEETVTSFALNLTLDDLKAVADWVGREMKRFSTPAEATPGK
jgi:hypothetical protein